jgi:hypothetical protein
MNHARYVEKGRFSRPALIFGRTDADGLCQSPSHDFLRVMYVGQSEQHSPLAFVLRNAAIACFPMAKEILDDVKGVLHTRPSTFGLRSHLQG